jgi:hypothetical protein
MLKKITALLLLMTFSNVYAFSPIEQSAVGEQELSKTFDSLNYKLNVEWDQKDANFFNKAIAGFEEEIATLQNSGMTKEELMKYTLEKIKDQSIKNEINELAKVIRDSKMTNEEARDFTISKLNSTYSHGASWSGGRIGLHVALIVGIIVVTIIVIHNQQEQQDDDPTYHHACYYLPAGCGP